jgi:exodeoxyribonuclease-3
MKIVSWNVNGIRSRETRLLEFIEKHQPDVLGLQEVKAHPDTLAFTLKFVPGYEVVWNWCKTKHGYSGTAIYYKSELSPTNIVTEMGSEKFDIEGRYIQIDIGNLSIVNGYFPFGGNERLDYKLEYQDKITEISNKLKSDGKKVVVMGDINVCHTEIDLFDPILYANKSCFLPKERQWLTDFLKSGFIDTFRMFNKEPRNYTWWSYQDKLRVINRGLRLDYIFVDKNLVDSIKSASIMKDEFGSDHCPISCEIDL